MPTVQSPFLWLTLSHPVHNRNVNPMNTPQQPLALIVGGSSGMGLATARLLGKKGIPIAIVGRSDRKLAEAESELRAMTEVQILRADLYDKDDVAGVINFAEDISRPIRYPRQCRRLLQPETVHRTQRGRLRRLYGFESINILHIPGCSQKHGC